MIQEPQKWPRKMIHEVCFHLSYSDLYQLSKVNRAWNLCISLDDDLWEEKSKAYGFPRAFGDKDMNENWYDYFRRHLKALLYQYKRFCIAEENFELFTISDSMKGIAKQLRVLRLFSQSRDAASLADRNKSEENITLCYNKFEGDLLWKLTEAYDLGDILTMRKYADILVELNDGMSCAHLLVYRHPLYAEGNKCLIPFKEECNEQDAIELIAFWRKTLQELCNLAYDHISIVAELYSSEPTVGADISVNFLRRLNDQCLITFTEQVLSHIVKLDHLLYLQLLDISHRIFKSLAFNVERITLGTVTFTRLDSEFLSPLTEQRLSSYLSYEEDTIVFMYTRSIEAWCLVLLDELYGSVVVGLHTCSTLKQSLPANYLEDLQIVLDLIKLNALNLRRQSSGIDWSKYPSLQQLDTPMVNESETCGLPMNGKDLLTSPSNMTSQTFVSTVANVGAGRIFLAGKSPTASAINMLVSSMRNHRQNDSEEAAARARRRQIERESKRSFWDKMWRTKGNTVQEDIDLDVIPENGELSDKKDGELEAKNEVNGAQSSKTPAIAMASVVMTKFDMLLSIELAVEMMHWNRDAIQRASSLHDSYSSWTNSEARDSANLSEHHVCQLFLQLLHFLGNFHLEPAMKLAIEALGKITPIGSDLLFGFNNPCIQFLEMVHIADLVHQCLHAYYEDEIVKRLKNTEYADKAARKKKLFERMLDENVASGINRTIEVLVQYVRHVLKTEQLQSEFDVAIPVTPDATPPIVHCTPACMKACSFIEQYIMEVLKVLDRNTADIFLSEVGHRIFVVLCEHFKMYQFRNFGVEQLVCDIEKYHDTAKKFQHSKVTQQFDALKDIGIMFTAPADQLRVILAHPERFQGALSLDDLRNFIKMRPDYRQIHKALRDSRCSLL